VPPARWRAPPQRRSPSPALVLQHRADEADALALQRLDQPLLLAAVADGGARRVDAVGERRSGDDGPPDRPIMSSLLTTVAVQIR
jgi:hypothetical protein